MLLQNFYCKNSNLNQYTSNNKGLLIHKRIQKCVNFIYKYYLITYMPLSYISHNTVHLDKEPS